MRLASALLLAPLLTSGRSFAQSEPVPVPNELRPPEPSTPLPTLPPPSAPAASSMHRIFGYVAGGYAYQNLFGVPSRSADVAGVIGANVRRLGIGGALDVTAGHTQGGLTAFGVFVGPLVEAHLGRVRVGGGFRFGLFNVERITTVGGLTTFSAGLYTRRSRLTSSSSTTPGTERALRDREGSGRPGRRPSLQRHDGGRCIRL